MPFVWAQQKPSQMKQIAFRFPFFQHSEKDDKNEHHRPIQEQMITYVEHNEKKEKQQENIREIQPEYPERDGNVSINSCHHLTVLI